MAFDISYYDKNLNPTFMNLIIYYFNILEFYSIFIIIKIIINFAITKVKMHLYLW